MTLLNASVGGEWKQVYVSSVEGSNREGSVPSCVLDTGMSTNNLLSE